MNSYVTVIAATAVAAWPAAESAGIIGQVKAAPSAVTRPSKPNKMPDATLARVRSRITRDGPLKYLRSVSESDSDWQHLLDKLSTADPMALSLAKRLRPSADASNAEALDISAARGLPYAPIAVLDLVHAGASVSALCTSPFIEPEAGVEKRYNQKAVAALDRVPVAQRPQPMFERCRRALAAVGKKL